MFSEKRTLILDDEAVAKLEYIRTLDGLPSIAAVVERACGVYELLLEHKSKGGTIEAMNADGTMTQSFYPTKAC